MKTYKSKKFVFFMMSTFFLSILLGREVYAKEKRNWPNSPAIQAKAALVMDVNTGTVLIEKNSVEKTYPASITKIMTALIALENAKSLDEIVFFPREAILVSDKDSSSIGMLPGEELTLRDCLHALMLASANEVANAIAIHIGGSIEEFVDLMNQKAKELGCVNTHFNNPNGLHDPEHYTCAVDMAKIGREAIKYEDFKNIAGTRTYIIPETKLMKEKRPIANYHQMINPAKFPQYAYEYCYAGKTGYTREAGMTLVSFAKKGTMNLICVVLKAETRDAQYVGTSKLFNFCFKRFRMEQAEKIKFNYESSEFFSKLKERDPAAKFYTPPASMVVIPKKCDINQIRTEFKFQNINKFSMNENVVGEVEYSYNGKSIGTYPLLYNAEDEMVLQNDEVKNDSQQVKDVKEEMNKENKGEELIYKIIIGIGVAIILLSLISLILYVRANKKRHYIHRSLRRSRRRNRLR